LINIHWNPQHNLQEFQIVLETAKKNKIIPHNKIVNPLQLIKTKNWKQIAIENRKKKQITLVERERELCNKENNNASEKSQNHFVGTCEENIKLNHT